jgi:hypothetical protein
MLPFHFPDSHNLEVDIMTCISQVIWEMLLVNSPEQGQKHAGEGVTIHEIVSRMCFPFSEFKNCYALQNIISCKSIICAQPQRKSEQNADS